MQQVAVVIPLYKDEITKFEAVSLTACNRHLFKHPIRLVGPKGLDFDKYLSYFPDSIDITAIALEPNNFESIASYNRLMLSPWFYKLFKNFEYILIYQADAYVFRDELEYWCNQGYDYIGAPWFEEWKDASHESKFIGVGNGGFSLRKVNSIIKRLRVLRLIQLFISNRLFHENNEDGILTFDISSIIYPKIKHELLKRLFDRLLGISNYKVANYKSAIKFSFEHNLNKIWLDSQKKLPFGCHAWHLTYEAFWCKHIG